MRRHRWRRALSVAAGFAVGLGVWLGTSELYTPAIAQPAQWLLRATENPPVTRLSASGKEVIVDRSDFPARSARPGIPLHDLSFNFILLTSLFAANVPPFSNRNVGMYLLAALLLYLTHVAALAVAVKSIYALQLGAWSEAHYGPIARNVWSGTAHFYRLVGMYAVAFALWWLLRPLPATAAGASRRVRKKGRR